MLHCQTACWHRRSEKKRVSEVGWGMRRVWEQEEEAGARSGRKGGGNAAWKWARWGGGVQTAGVQTDGARLEPLVLLQGCRHRHSCGRGTEAPASKHRAQGQQLLAGACAPNQRPAPKWVSSQGDECVARPGTTPARRGAAPGRGPRLLLSASRRPAHGMVGAGAGE